jgi:uncharacterized membrane protein
VIWTRPRIALVACAAAQGLAMLYVGVFQIGWASRLACPGFGAGCESVALAPFAWPLGFADGLLATALAGVLTALVQVERREAGAAVVGLAGFGVLVYLIWFFEMQRFHAWDFWRVLAGLLSLAIAALAYVSERGRAVAPGDRPQQGE